MINFRKSQYHKIKIMILRDRFTFFLNLNSRNTNSLIDENDNGYQHFD